MHAAQARMCKSWGARGFSLAELLVVTGIIALLISVMLPPLHAAHKQAQAAQCGAQLQQIGLALESGRAEHRGFYPLWDDGGSPTRYTWIDLLVQQRLLPTPRIGYCPDDLRPSELSAARGLQQQVIYPGSASAYGIDYSYGIAVPLSAGSWAWTPTGDEPVGRRYVLEDYERSPGQRVLAGDAHWSTLYNLSGDALEGHDWSYPTQYDNMVAWRHRGLSANMLFQDGHVSRLKYLPGKAEPVNTAKAFVWFPGESMNIAPGYSYQGNDYPNRPLVTSAGEARGNFPQELVPKHYTDHMLWTQIPNK